MSSDCDANADAQPDTGANAATLAVTNVGTITVADFGADFGAITVADFGADCFG